jgi:3-dehydroquinate synthase
MEIPSSHAHHIKVSTSAEGSAYPVVVGSGSLSELPALLREYAPAYRYVVIADARVASFHKEEVQRILRGVHDDIPWFTFPPGEGEKTRERWSQLTDALLESGLGRDTCILALGGGVTGDLAGFVAATYMRGVPIVQIPTSLVAMIDSSVGGKTGVDTFHGKNLVGAFHPPVLVLADPRLARTLPREERAQGLVEAIKHGAILDRTYLEGLEARVEMLLAGDEDATTWCVHASVQHKAAVVQEDEREGGRRKILNFGHTLGHALEQTSRYRIPHGTAVARGMVLEARLGERLGVTPAGTADTLALALERFGLVVDAPLPASPSSIVSATRNDKKARGGAVHYVLLQALGSVVPDPGWSRPVPDDVVMDVLEPLGVEG